MRHSFLDKYSGINSPIHRISPRVKLIFTVGFILLFIYTPTGYFILPALLLVLFISLSKVPPAYIVCRSVVVIPFILLGAVSGNWMIVVRAYFAVLTSILLSATTKFTDILSALKLFNCPKVFLMIMAFMYRYFFVLADELLRMNQAKVSRTISRRKKDEIKTLAHLIGLLFVRSYEKAERVYLAMCARGFSGEIK